MKLSIVERMILMNQNRILAKLDPGNAENYEQHAEILRCGYERLYTNVFEHMYESSSEESGEEVFQIFDMYRALDHAYKLGLKKPDEGRPDFAGFDGNNDDQFGIASFILDNLGLYQEQKHRPRNSHSRAELPIYRAMVAEWKTLGKPYPLSQTQIDQIVGAWKRK